MLTYEDEAKITELLDEIAPGRLTLKCQHIMQLFDCKAGVAYKIMRSAKDCSDIVNAKGYLTKTDFIRWYFRKEARQVQV